METNTLTVEFNCSCAWPMTESARRAFRSLSDTDKIDAVIEILKARYDFAADTDGGKKAKKLLTNYFGEGFADKSDFKGPDRLMFTLDLSRTVFRCWYSCFGRVSRFGCGSPISQTHFDSCGRGMVFHIQGSDQKVLENLALTLTKNMVEWKSPKGTLWAGYEE